LVTTACGAKRNELRGVWISDPTVFSWDNVIREVKNAGLNTIFVNFASAGVAFYDSDILPSRLPRASLAELVDKAHAADIKVHAKILTFFMYWAPPEEAQAMIADGRVLKNIDGKPHLQANTPWLDPSQRVIRKRAERIIYEILERFPIDGIQLDYVRFYEESDVPESIMDIRRTTLTNFLFELDTNLHRKYPDTRTSACIFYDPDRARNEMAQDWPTWVERGMFNFMVPMNYTTDTKSLRRWLSRQEKIRAKQATFYSGLGSYMEKMTPKLLVKEISMVQKSGLPGFILFSYNDDRFRKDFVPALHKRLR